MPSTVNLKAVGLNVQPNNLDNQEGSLNVASNIIIRRDNVIESRRGFKLYGNSMSSVSKQMLSYKNLLLRHYDDVLQWDAGDGEFTSFAGSYNETETGLRIKGLESNGNFYFTTSDGIKKIAAKVVSDLTSASGYITQAGGVKALDTQATLNITLGDSSGFLPADSAVAYRIVWGIRDVNSNLILGTPSQRVEVYNSLASINAGDINNVLRNIDNATSYPAVATLLSDTNYLATLEVDGNSVGSTQRTTVLGLAAKLDNDIIYAADVPSAPTILNISSAAVATGGVCTINFSAGDARNYLSAGSIIKLAGFVGFTPLTDNAILNDIQTVASVDPAAGAFITFNTTASVGAVTITGSFIYSGEYEDITDSTSPDFPSLVSLDIIDPATAEELGTIQNALERIISRLKDENSLVIDTTALNTYITPLAVTTSATVTLEFTIPDDVTTSHFYQIYRSAIVTATGTTVLSDLTPSDELQLVYEAFPTTAELAAQFISVQDVTPDQFRGANLYTNASTGDGILQANDVPPAAKDINKFKNYTFYANTRTRHRYSLNMLGVQQLIDLYNGVNIAAGIVPVITIADNNTSTSYRFVTGLQEITNVYAESGTTNAAGSYFLAYSANDEREYYFWFRRNTAGVLTGTDPGTALPGKIGVVIDVNSADSDIVVAGHIRAAFDSVNRDFYTGNFSVTFAPTDVNTTTEKITITNQNLVVNDVMQFTTSGTLPAPLVVATDYFVKTVTTTTSATTGITTQDFTLATTPGGSTINLTAQGTGVHTAATSPTVVKVINVNEGSCTNFSGGSSAESFDVVQDGRGEDLTTNTVLLSQQASVALAVSATAQSLVKVINRSSSTVYAYYLSGAQDVPGKILLESRNIEPTSNPFYISSNNPAVGSSFNPVISPELSVDAGANIVQNGPNLEFKVSGHGLLTGDQVIISGTIDATPSLAVDGVWTITKIDANHFSIVATASSATVLSQMVGVTYLPDSQVADNEVKPNRVYYSKVNQPEAVPLLNFIDLGAENKVILRILPLRDSLFVFKEDGLFRISGEVAPFSQTLFDGSCILIAPDSLGTLNNVVYGWTRKGIETITESGIQSPTVSRPIDTIILPLASAAYTNFTTATWGTGYESDNSYLVYTVVETDDEVATIAYRYSNLTNSWTTFDKTNTCGIVGPVDDVLYLGAGDVFYTEKERKNFDRTDYADREIEKTLLPGGLVNNGYGMHFVSVDDFQAGDVIVQTQLLTVYEYNALLQKLDIDPGVADDDYFETLEAVAGDNLRTKLVELTTKLDLDSGVAFSDYAARITGDGGSYSTTISTVSTANPTVITTPATNTKNFATTDVNTGTNVITVTAHGFVEGTVVNFSSSGTLPAGLIAGTDFYLISVTANTFQVSNDGSTAIDITTVGSGTHTVFNGHGLFSITGPAEGRFITISGLDTNAEINGVYEITRTGARTFTIPVNVISVTYGIGSFTRFEQDPSDIKSCFNIIVQHLNADTGVFFSNYTRNTTTSIQEAVITNVNKTSKIITLNIALDFVQGSMILYKHIATDVEYSPQTMGDPLGFKHLRESTVMFESKNFTSATVSFATDLLPEAIPVNFNADSNGIFGHSAFFGSGFFGGGGNSAPFRTYVPATCQRCRYLIVSFNHHVARERYAILGVSITGEVSLSSRAYK